jgi:hypothetical protein
MNRNNKRTVLYKKVFFDIETSQFSFYLDIETKNDIIKFENSTLTKVTLGDIYDMYYFAYNFKSSISSKLRTQFFNELRFGTVFQSEKDKEVFIIKATTELNKLVLMSKFGAIIYPKSRSEMNKEIVKRLNKFFRVIPATFELVKQIPKDIRFNSLKNLKGIKIQIAKI